MDRRREVRCADQVIAALLIAGAICGTLGLVLAFVATVLYSLGCL